MIFHFKKQNYQKHSITYDAQQKKLTIRHATHIPREAFDYADEVEILDMSYGHMTTLPKDLDHFKKMRVAFFSHHDFEEIPPVLSSCDNLEMVGFKSCKIKTLPDYALPRGIKGLILTDNQLSQLPNSLGEYSHLKKLMLAGNRLDSLPEELLSCQNLELLRLPINNVIASPDWLFALPKLAWYTDAANPFHNNESVQRQGLKEIAWDELELGEKLGESANNKVYRALRNNGEEVAVKLYGSGITTDGLPIDEMHASLLAGIHPNIIGGIGKLIHAPDNQQGLIFPLVPNEFTTLGKPPNFKTFTRDVYPHIDTFTLSFVTHVFKDIVAAMTHCHSKGIMHGDIYAHNILSNEAGKSYIGDFGAASTYVPNTAGGKLRELIDVRGFGYLMDDLLSRVALDRDQTIYTELEKIKKACLETTIQKRPQFIEIRKSLADL